MMILPRFKLTSFGLSSLFTNSRLSLLVLLLILANPSLAEQGITPVTGNDNLTTSEPQGNTRENSGQGTNTSSNKDEELSPQQQAESEIKNSIADLDIIQQTLESLSKEIDSSKEKSSINHSSMQAVRDGLELIENKLKNAYNGLDESRSSINVNSSNIEKVHEELLESTRDIRANATDLDTQKSLIEDNSIRLYEILIRISSIRESVKRFSGELKDSQNADKSQSIETITAENLNRLWRLLATVLVFLAPLAFALSNNFNNNTFSNSNIKQNQEILLVCMGSFLGYFAIGFSLTYGTTYAGLVGSESYLIVQATITHPDQEKETAENIMANIPFIKLLLYKSGFIMFAALIIYTAISKYLSSLAHLFLAFAIGAVIMPIFGHWGWASHFVPTNKGWLDGIGFIDQSGSIIIHAVAAWFALTMMLKLERSSPSQPSEQPLKYSLYSSPIILLLWMSWLGFSAGNLSITDEQVPTVLLNVSLAGIMGSLIAFMHCNFFNTDKNHVSQMLYGGFISGLVAIAACAQSVTFVEALVIGAVAGLVQNLAFSLLRKTFLRKDGQVIVAQLIAIHGFASIWGAVSVALFGTENTFSAPDLLQMVTQMKGIAIAITYSVVMAHIMLFLLMFRRKKQTQKYAE